MALRIIAGIVAGLLINIQTVSAQVLDSVEVTQDQDTAAIQARFSTPIQYVRHFPAKSGDTLQIYLRIVLSGSDKRAPFDSTDERRTFRPAKLDGLPLRDVRYESGGIEGPRLIVHFAHKTAYTVRVSNDQRSIIIHVPLVAAAARDRAASTFVVNLATLNKPLVWAPILPSDLRGNRVYLIPYSDDSGTRYRLRLGFFDTPEDAVAIKNRLKPQFPNASVSLTNASERDESEKFALAPPSGDRTPPSVAIAKFKTVPPLPPTPVPALPLPPPVAEVPPPLSTKEEPIKAKPLPKTKTASDRSAEKLFAAGRAALLQGNNPKAIDLFTEILNLPSNTRSADAQELLGLALERNKQIALAKVEYKLYLKQYPEGEGAQRVAQRLAVLEPATATLLNPATNVAPPSDYQSYGTIAQNYYHGATKVDSTTAGTNTGINPAQATFTQTDQSLLVTHADAVSRYRNERYDNRAVFSGDVLTDFLHHDKSSERVSSAYIELANRGHTALARLGRQSGNARGVLGRFDGALVGDNFLPLWRTDVVVGRPVDTIAPASRRVFTGVDLALGPFRESWNASVYAIQQNVDNFVDRRAVGSELRYFDSKRTMFSLLDYDVYFKSLNIAMAQGNWQTTPATNFNFLIDHRKSPPLELTNALQTEPATSIHELAATLNEQQIKQLARSRTANSNVAVVGITHTLGPRVQLGGNLTYLKITDSALGQGTGNIVTYDTQLIANNVIFRDDVDVLSLSYSDGRDFKGRAVSMVSRLPLGKKWRADFNLRLYRQDNMIGTRFDRVTPSLKVDYRTPRGLTLESEWGYERTHTTGLGLNETTGSTFFMVGWRLDW